MAGSTKANVTVNLLDEPPVVIGVVVRDPEVAEGGENRRLVEDDACWFHNWR